MGLLLREALRRLCAQTGWSYAVFWNAIRCGNSRHLVWADGHHEPTTTSTVTGTSLLEPMESLLKECDVFRAISDEPNRLAEFTCQVEDAVGNLLCRMRSQVHVVGDGVVGRAAINGNHQWILHSGEGYISENLGEMTHQFFVGIKTIAVIPVLPYGVVQLGSTQMVMENMAFIEHVRQSFLQLGCVPGALLAGGLQRSLVPQKESSSMYGKPLLDKVPVNLKPTTTMVGMSINNCSDQAVLPSILHHNGPLEGILSNTDVQCQQTRTHESYFGNQHQHSLVGGSSLSSSRVSHFGGQLLPNVLQRNFVNSTPTSDTTKSIQLWPHGKIVSSALNDSKSLVGREESSNNGNQLRISGLLPCGTEREPIGIQNVNAYAIAKAQLVSSTNHSSSNSTSVEVTQSTTDKHMDGISTVTMSNVGNDLSQALENPHIDPNTSTLCSAPSTYIVQDCWVNCSSPFQSTHGDRSFVCVDSSPSKNVQKDDVECKSVHIVGASTSAECFPHISGDDLFDILGTDFKSKHYSRSLDAFAINGSGLITGESGTYLSTCISQLEVDPIFDVMHDEIFGYTGIFSETGPDQLLDAVVSKINSGSKQVSDDDLYRKTNNSLVHKSSIESGWASLQQQMHGEHFGLPPLNLKVEPASSSVKSAGSMDKTGECSQKDATYKSQISLWVENGQNMQIDSMLPAQCKKIDEVGKSNRKRPRPGESPRPRPKDRQMIQDRVKELREIVPNGAKCSIDALLERTIKHMLFLQCVTKHADKLRETGEPKIISKEGGLLLKDNFEGGATWAFEVGTRSMVCPIIVEDLNPPRQLLVEMLCEERGFFLEIADLIRGLGLTILKGVMEARNDKVWARFAVEANRDVTRMDIFMSLVRLLEPSAGSGVAALGFNNGNIPCNMVCQSSIPATGLANHLQ